MDEIKSTSLRIDEKLHAKIVNDAKKERRSISAQIIYMIEKYYEIQEITKP